MYVAFNMVKIKPCRLGSGGESNSSHSERMHQYFLTRLGYQTRQRTHNFAQHVSTRYYEAFSIDKAEECASDQLMDLADVDKHWKEEDNEDVEDGMESQLEWNYHDEDISMTSDLTQHLGKYGATAIESETRDKERMYEVKWNNRDRQVLRTKLNKRLIFSMSG